MHIHSIVNLVPHLVGHAYLDPGSGSFILQLLIATVLGSFFIIRGYWSKIKAFITRRPIETDQKEDEDE